MDVWPYPRTSVGTETFSVLLPGMWHRRRIYTGNRSICTLRNGATVGASGAIYAILLGFGMLFPNQPLFIFPLPFPIKAKYFVIGYALIELYAGFANNPGDNVAHFAHLGGMIFGFILIMYWRKKDRGNGYYYN